MKLMNTRKNRLIKRENINKLSKEMRFVFFEDERGEFGMSSIIGIAIGLIIAAFVLLPGIESFAESIMSDMQSWWTNTIGAKIFPN